MDVVIVAAVEKATNGKWVQYGAPRFAYKTALGPYKETPEKPPAQPPVREPVGITEDDIDTDDIDTAAADAAARAAIDKALGNKGKGKKKPSVNKLKNDISANERAIDLMRVLVLTLSCYIKLIAL